MGTKSVFPQVIAFITLMMKGFITLMMKGFITSSQLVDSGAVMVKSAFPGERAHRRRSALGVMDRYGDTVGGPLLISSRFGVTPSPAHSKVTAEYGSSPEIAGTPAPGSALMSSLGLRPSLDRWLRRGRLARRA